MGAGQLTAARAVGFTPLQGLRFVVLPQARRSAIPGWSSELVSPVEYSSLAAFISVRELFFRSRAVASQTFRYTAMLTFVARFHLTIVLTARPIMARDERETAIPGLGQVRAGVVAGGLRRY